MSHHNHSENSNHRQETAPSGCCSTASAELKLYQAFIFSVPIFFTFVLLLLFYLIYLRRRRLNWSSLQMRTSRLLIINDISSSEMGLKKEVREMLPIIVFKESFSVTDTQCSVCLGDYQAEDRLQQIPACGHTFHMDCIDHWLSTHTTCPLCRLSLLPPPLTTKPPSTQPPLEEQRQDEEEENIHRRPSSIAEEDESSASSSSIQSCSHSCEDPPLTHRFPETANRDSQRFSETGGAASEIV